MTDLIRTFEDLDHRLVLCQECGAAVGEPCQGGQVHMSRWAEIMDLADPIMFSRFRAWLTAEHADGTPCPRTGTGKHAQRPLDPRCSGRAFYVTHCKACGWKCRKPKRKDAEDAARMHVRFCADQSIRDRHLSPQDRNERHRRNLEQQCRAALAVECPQCGVSAGEACLDRRRKAPAPYRDGHGPTVHVKRRILHGQMQR
ncbi:hypothetical protein [Streptomyces sp. NPDC087298]|uniref:zinc finger domain-containing protein n=1 Tax=Streptomyces sp. NPDC087298 TaxID=3365779 RepID=UPI0037F7C93E